MESLTQSQLHARLRQLSAEAKPDRSSSKAHVYYSGPTRKWIRVRRDPRRPGNFVVDYHNTCPCSLEDV